MDAFIANLKYAIRNRETVTIGGGEFSGDELKEVAEALVASKAQAQAASLPGGARPAVLDLETFGSRIRQALPSVDQYERGYRDCLESVVLALAPKIETPILEEAVTTALDAYANNVDDDSSARYDRPSS